MKGNPEMSDPTERGLPNPFGGLVDKIEARIEEIKAEAARRVRVAIALENISISLSRLKDLDPDNGPTYAACEAELAARK